VIRSHAYRPCAVCGEPLDELGRHARRPWSSGELLAVGWILGVLTLAGVSALASWLLP
jgi:hypothetical protein